MVSIPRNAKRMWEKWNLRVFIVSSLSLQAILIVSAPFRKRTSNIWVIFLVWSAYLLADVVALFTLGLISNKQDDNNKQNPNSDLMAFWAPFCLLHLGGPDTITAFSLQDNSLWPRHLVGLIFQVSVSLYVFIQSLPANKLWLPISFLFVASIIKYTERTRALYLANLDTFMGNPGLNYAKLMQEYVAKRQANVPTKMEMVGEQRKKSIATDYPAKGKIPDDIAVVQRAHNFFEKFNRLIIDQLVLLVYDRNESREYFHESIPEVAFRVLSAELNFFYDVLYTKAFVVHSKLGYVFHIISTLSILVSFSLYIISPTKQSSPCVDVYITYVLFGGAITLDILALFLMVFSDWTVVALGKKLESYPCVASILTKYLEIKRLNWPSDKIDTANCCFRWARKFVFTRWSGSVRGFNLIDYCLKELPKSKSHKIKLYCHTLYIKTIRVLGLNELLEKRKHVTKKDINLDLWDFIFQEIQKKSIFADDLAMAKIMSAARGDWVFRGQEDTEINELIMFYTVKLEYGESLFLWHIATEICYNIDKSESKSCEFSKVLSDYMMYLLHLQPNLMSSVVGIGEIRFRDTCAEANRFFIQAQLSNLEEACRRIVEVNTNVKPSLMKGTKSKSVLFDACILAKELNNKLKEKKWKVMSQVWVELLSYAACRCRPDPHMQLLGKGGELITYVWLLLAHFGIGEQLYVTEDNATARLLVGK